MSDYLTPQQIAQLLQPISPKRVLSRDGMAYVAAHDVKAHLTRIFGFARWSSDVISQELVFEEQVTMRNNKPGWYVCYRSLVRLTICSPGGTVLASFTEGHVGDNTGPTRGDVHGNALANSESYALKRCAAMLGNQFGLSLYDKGSLKPVVWQTLVTAGERNEAEDVQDGAEVQSLGNDERQQDTPESVTEPVAVTARQVEIAQVEAATAEDVKAKADALIALIALAPKSAKPLEYLNGCLKQAQEQGLLGYVVGGITMQDRIKKAIAKHAKAA